MRTFLRRKRRAPVGAGGTGPSCSPAFLLDAPLTAVSLATLWQSQRPSLPKK